MLADVAIAPHPRGVLCHQSLLTMFLGDDIDDTCDGVAAIERTRGSLHNLYLLDVMRVDEGEVVLTTIVAIEPTPVNQNQYVGVAQAVHLQVGAHIVLAEVEAGGES